MDRRTVITTAGAITLTVLAGSTAIAANVGILGRQQKDPVGELSPVATLETTVTSSTAVTVPPEVETVYIDEVVKVGGSGEHAPTGVAGVSGSGDAAPPAVDMPAAAPGATVPYDDDDEHENDHDDEDEREDEREGDHDDEDEDDDDD